MFHVFVISFCIAMNRSDIIPPVILFFSINNLSILVQKSNFALVFLKAPCHANPSAIKNEEGKFHIPEDIFHKFSNTSAKDNVLF